VFLLFSPSRAGIRLVFDLPAFDALLFNTSGPGLVVRYDDGQADLVATLARHDFVQSVAVEADGTLFVRTHQDERRLRLSRAPSEPIIQGTSFVVGERRVRFETGRMEAQSIGKIIVNDLKSGLTELGAGGPLAIALPFDPLQERIEKLVEVPEYKAVLIITNASTYAIQDNGIVREIRGARKAGVSRAGLEIPLIPVRHEAIFLGSEYCQSSGGYQNFRRDGLQD
jgi:hypothetical protein